MGQNGFSVTKTILILVLILLIAGIGVGVYLLNQRQTLSSRASQDWLDAFAITDLSEKAPLICDKTANPPVCTTAALEFKVKVKDLSLLNNVLGEELVVSPSPTMEPTASPVSTPQPTPAPAASTQASVLPTPTATPQGSAAASGRVLSITVNGVELDLSGKLPSTIRLVEGKQSYDVPVIITSVDNRTNYFAIKFNFIVGSARPAANSSASPQPSASTPVSQAASPRPSGSPVSSKMDLNRDGVLNSVDTAEFLKRWNAKSLSTLDINSDGRVNIFDFSALKEAIDN